MFHEVFIRSGLEPVPVKVVMPRLKRFSSSKTRRKNSRKVTSEPLTRTHKINNNANCFASTSLGSSTEDRSHSCGALCSSRDDRRRHGGTVHSGFGRAN